MITNIIILIILAVLFILCAFLSQKTDKNFIVIGGVIIAGLFFVYLCALILNLINTI